MMDPIVSILKQILLNMVVTNSEEQAARWASVIIEELRAADISIEESSVIAQMIQDCK